MSRRWLIISGLTALFMVLLLGMVSCSALENFDGAGLQNNMGGGNGPGSGNWKPRAPQGANQCGEFRGVLANLRNEGNELSSRIDKLYVVCYDGEGKLLVTADREACVEPLRQMMTGFKGRYADFIRGADVYAGACAQEAGEGEEKPDPPDPPKEPPKGDPPETEDPGGDDDDDRTGCPPWCCLTCINNIDMNYTIVDGPVRLPGS